MKEILFKNKQPFVEDILSEITKLENCGSGHIKKWYRDMDKNFAYNGIIKYELYNENDVDSKLIEIMKEVGIEYKLNGENSIIFNKANFFWDFELIHSKWTGKYKLIYSKENKKGEYMGSVEKEFVKPETVIRNIKKLIEK